MKAERYCMLISIRTDQFCKVSSSYGFLYVQKVCLGVFPLAAPAR